MEGDTRNDLLDAEFRQILMIIKSHIGHVNDQKLLEKYRVWLERLSEAHWTEKLERNNYLLALADQIREHKLLPPFTSNPPRGPLPKLATFRKDELDQIQWPYLTPRRSQSKNSSSQSIKSEKGVQRKKQHKNTAPRIIQPKSETSSWCDLTVSATSTNHTTDAEEEESKNRPRGGRQKTEDINEEVKLKQPTFDLTHFLSMEKSNSATMPTQQEVEALKLRMKDLLEVKNALRDTHCLTEGRKKTIEELQEKLSLAEKQNCELQSLMETQHTKLLEMEKLKMNELNDFKEKLTQLRLRELEHLKQRYQKEIGSLEAAHNDRIVEMKKLMEATKKDYEAKIRAITDSNLNLLRQKESEIQSLQSQFKIRDSQTSNEDNCEQISTLKHCISKLDKVLHKNEMDYLKRIEKLKKDLEVKEVTNKVEMQTQRADLIVRHSATKQEELKMALNSLEGKYKKMMESLQMQALETKKHDENLIAQLKGLLEKNRIVY